MPSGALNLGQIKGQVWSLVRDGGSFVTADDIEAWANEAQFDLAARLGLLQTEINSTITGGVIALPPDPDTQPEVARVLSLRLGTDDVEFTNDDVFHSWADSGDTPPHTLGRSFDGQIELYPVPADGTAYELRYEHFPEPFASDAASSALPHHLHPRIVFYARHMAFLKVDDLPSSERFLAMYLEGLPGPDLGRAKIDPGPIRVSRASGPFDTDAEARHF